MTAHVHGLVQALQQKVAGLNHFYGFQASPVSEMMQIRDKKEGCYRNPPPFFLFLHFCIYIVYVFLASIYFSLEENKLIL